MHQTITPPFHSATPRSRPPLPARFCPLAEPRSLACSSCLIASYLAPGAPVFHIAEHLKNLICTEVQGTYVKNYLYLGLIAGTGLF
jgi:hypothetical protein